MDKKNLLGFEHNMTVEEIKLKEARIKLDKYIDQVQDIVDFQTSNGLLTKIEAEEIQDKIKEARIKLDKKEEREAENLAHKVLFEAIDKINNKSLRIRLWHLWGLHIWIYLAALSIILFLLLINRWMDYTIFQDVSAEAIAWGGLGGCGYSIYHMRMNIYRVRLSKYYAIYWSVYPIAGMIFGLSVVIILAAGFISLEAKPTYPVYAGIAFLAGMFQEWIVKTLRDIAEAIHHTKESQE